MRPTEVMSAMACASPCKIALIRPKLLIVNQCISNSPSKIRGGRGALILPMMVVFTEARTPRPKGRPLLTEYKHLIFVELTLL